MMSQTDVEEIAAVLNANHAAPELVLDFASVLGAHSPLFNRQQFIAASIQNLIRDREVETRMLARALKEN